MKSLLSPIAAFLSFSLVPHVGSAQTCTEDSDCAPEEYCDRYPSGGDGSPPSMGGAADCEPGAGCDDIAVEEELPPVDEEPVMGQCELGGRECASDDQCLPDHYCSLDEVSTAACAPGADCTDLEPPEPRGRCEHEPYTCETDADCPQPTLCGEDGECYYEVEPCESDNQCSASYACLIVEGEASSSSQDDSESPPGETQMAGVPSGPADGDDGGDAAPEQLDPDDPPADEEEEAEATPQSEADAAEEAEAIAREMAEQGDQAAEDEEPLGVCFPEKVECESDDACQDGWICATLDDAPPGWEEGERVCLPPGIDAALKGDVEVVGGGSDGGGNSSNDDGASEEGEGGEIAEENINESSDVALGTQGGSEGTSNNGCSVHDGRANRSDAGWMLALLGVALAWRRRR